MTSPVEKDIAIEAVLPHEPAVVWRALTSADLVGRWLMPNHFAPIVGHKFTFSTKPRGDWDGIVHCEVLEIVENRHLVYSGKGGQRPAIPSLRSTPSSPGRCCPSTRERGSR